MQHDPRRAKPEAAGSHRRPPDDRQELAAAGGCLIINGLSPHLRGRLDKLVADGVLRKVKIGRDRKPKGSVQFGPRKCLLAFERVGEDL